MIIVLFGKGVPGVHPLLVLSEVQHVRQYILNNFLN